MISERFGRGSRTVDLELEAQIEVLRDTRRKYENVLRLARALTNHFYNMVQTQHALGDTFADLSQKSPELRVSRRQPLTRRRFDAGVSRTLISNFYVDHVCRMNLATTQRLRSCCARTGRLSSEPLTSLCPASTHWSIRPWRTRWWQ